MTLGYEGTINEGQPQNPSPKKYRAQPKCCKLTYRQGRYRWGSLRGKGGTGDDCVGQEKRYRCRSL